ncbi:MAG: amidase [Candidatus Latescibacteria bacterium]|nr:amidase [Candidatus Latescibacterota bacterium]
MPDAELACLDATAQAALVRQGAVTPLHLVDAAIARIDQLNPALNAVVAPLYDQARASAQSPLPQGPFTGVPYLLKDLVAAYEGVPLTAGTALLRHALSPCDSELVRRLKQAGLIVVGKTNTPELGCHVTTEPRLFGPTRNPWNRAYSSGGSSGGSAAAVAAGLVPAAHANDAGGSIRIPASCCGIFGLKPTRARTSLAPTAGDVASGIAIEHAVTRSVRDSAALLDVTAGPVAGDPYCAPPPERPFANEVGRDPGPLRIAWTDRTLAGTRLHPDCVAAVADSARLCDSLGHIVAQDSPPIDGEEFFAAMETVFCASMAWTIDGLARNLGHPVGADELEDLTFHIAAQGHEYSAAQYLDAVATLQGYGRVMAKFFQRFDLWLTPTLAAPPVPLGTWDFSANEEPRQTVRRIWSHIPFTPLCNTTGLPGMSVPLYWNKAGLPVGSHFTAPYGDEATLFRLAGQLEQARPWAQHQPPLSA